MEATGYAIVVGGGSGIGRACALAFAKAGSAGIAIADINIGAAREVAEECRVIMARGDEHNGSTRATEALLIDVTSETSVNQAMRHVAELYGRLDYCVNCAGIGVERATEIAGADLAEFSRFLDVNVAGTFLVTREASAIMARQEPLLARSPGISCRGTIVNMGSASSFASTPGMVQYTTSKHAVLGLTKNAALDNAVRGIRVNCICASWVDTPMVRKAIEKVPGLLSVIESAVPMGRMAQPNEIADAVIFLCGPRSSFITGCGLIIDGGTTLTSKV